jgi:DNA polymerase-3 subunit alpha
MEIKEWIESNNLPIDRWLGDKGFQIEDKKYLIVKPKNGLLFDDEFSIILDDNEKAYIGLYDYYTFEFGGKWYYSEKESISLKDLKYIGKFNIGINHMPFLGIHGAREICNGSRSYGDWVKKAKFLDYKSLGISEKNTLAGTFKFQQACESGGIKSILGYTTSIKNGDNISLIKLYVENELGWTNLLRIHKIATVDNENYIDHDKILTLSEGLILVLSTEFKWSDRYKDYINSFSHVFYQFDVTSFRSEQKDIERLNSVKFYIDNYIDKISPILISDAYYLDKEDFKIKKIFNGVISNEFENESKDQYLKSLNEIKDQIRELFSDKGNGEFIIQLAYENTVKISELCDFRIPTGVFNLPEYKLTKEEKSTHIDKVTMFWALIEKGIGDKYPNGMPELYYKRIEYEFSIIQEGGFIDYFLITWDICKFSDDNDIWRGLGRGSAPSSLILYLFNVTHIDPIEYDLPFERFLNPARIKKSLPDVDLDFESERREEIKEYIIKRYGVDQTCYIGNMGEFKIKSLIKDLAKEFEIPFGDVNYVSATIPNKLADMNFDEFFKYANKTKPLKEFIHKNPNLINYIPLGLGSYRTRGIHAAAVVVFPDTKKVYEWIPVREEKGVLISEFDGYELDALGFLKEDILGVKQVDKLKMMIRLIDKNYGIKIDQHKIPNDDQLTYFMFQEGYTQDIFQFNSPGMITFLKDMIPEVIHDLIAANALYRPGAMLSGMHNDYVNVKNGYAEPSYDHPLLEEVLSDTYGVYCIEENQNILTVNGLKKIKDVEVNDLVLTENGEYREVEKSFYNGVKNTIRIRSSFGEELICTKNHKILTQRGWVEAKNLIPKKDIIKCFWVNKEKFKKGNDKDWLVGLWLADGSCQNTTPSITCSDENFANIVKNIADKNFDLDCKVYFRIRAWYVSMRSKEGYNGSFSKDYKENLFLSHLRRLKLNKCNVYNKELPNNYTLSTLSGFIEGDGCLYNNRIKICNEKLAYQLFLGFQSYRIHSSYYNDNDVYTIRFSDDKNILKYKIKKSNKKNINYVPREYIYKYKRILGRKYRGHFRNSCPDFISKNFLIKNSIPLGHSEWGLVSSIKNNKLSNVYDLSIKDIHSYVTNGHVTHNCYQEQIMAIVQVLADFTLAEADEIRRAIGKKDLELMQKSKKDFIQRGGNKGIDADIMSGIWDKIENFAQYSFNRSHSACYAIIGYRAQYLKANYPVAFWTTSLQKLTGDSKASEKLPYYLHEINKTKKVRIYPPDINRSGYEFISDYDKNKIYWNLPSIKYVGDVAVQNIIESRENGERFFSMNDFCKRIDKSKVNKRIVINLILSGCFDEVYNVKEEKERIGIIEAYHDVLKNRISETFYSKETINNYWWILKQKELSGLGEVDYKGIVPEEMKKDFFELSTFFSNDVVDSHVSISGTVLEIVERNSRNGKFANVTLNHNSENLNMTIWNDCWLGDKKWANLIKDAKIKSKIVFLSGKIREDTYRKTNALVSVSNKSKIHIL